MLIFDLKKLKKSIKKVKAFFNVANAFSAAFFCPKVAFANSTKTRFFYVYFEFVLRLFFAFFSDPGEYSKLFECFKYVRMIVHLVLDKFFLN